MPRPKKMRWVVQNPHTEYFGPHGDAATESSEVVLHVDELEAVRLADYEGLRQEEGAAEMNVSRATFGRIVLAARRKIADALIHGKALRIQGGQVTIVPQEGHGRRHRHRGGGGGRGMGPHGR